MAQIMYKKLEHPVDPHCLSASTFYKLRRTFVEWFVLGQARLHLIAAETAIDIHK